MKMPFVIINLQIRKNTTIVITRTRNPTVVMISSFLLEPNIMGIGPIRITPPPSLFFPLLKDEKALNRTIAIPTIMMKKPISMRFESKNRPPRVRDVI